MLDYIKMWYYKLFGEPVEPEVKKERKLLSQEEVKEIEILLASTSHVYTQVELALRYGVSTSVLSKIKLGNHRYSTQGE